MLIIRPEQMDALWPALEGPLLEGIREFVKTHHATAIVRARGRRTVVAKLSDGALDGLVRAGVAKARGHVAWEAGELRAYVSLMFAVAPNFDEQPDIARVLSNKRLPLAVRLRQACESLEDSAWENARFAYDESSWGDVELGEAAREVGDGAEALTMRLG